MTDTPPLNTTSPLAQTTVRAGGGAPAPKPAAAASAPPIPQQPWAQRNGGGHAVAGTDDPARSDPTKFAQVVDPATGDVVLKPRDGTGNDAPPADPANAAPATDGEKLKVGDYELSPADIAALMQQKAENDLRAAKIPATPDGYKIELPTDFKLPDGVEFHFDTDNPAFKDVQKFAHAKGWDQSDLSTVLSFYAANEARNATAINTARAAEIAKIGPNATARVDAISTFLRGHLGDDIAKPFMATLATAAQVDGWEKLMQKMAGGGGAGFSQRGRDTGDGDKLSNEAYQALSYTDKKAYAARFPQADGSGPASRRR